MVYEEMSSIVKNLASPDAPVQSAVSAVEGLVITVVTQIHLQTVAK